MKKTIIITVLTLITVSKVFSTTWNEPWQDAIIKKSESFVLCKVTYHDSAKVSAKLIKNIAGTLVADSFEVDGFYFLDLTSRSASHGIEFEFGEQTDTLYFFLVKGENSKYQISTPTSGFAHLRNGKVFSTYRHTYHQALIGREIYEITMKAIFNSYKGLPYDTIYVGKFIESSLSPPPGIGDVFFNQHVALETIYHLKLTGYEKQIMPFIDFLDNFHHQVSGIRALSVTKTKETKEKLMNVLKGKQDNFSKVIAVWALGDLDAKEYKKDLKKIAQKKSSKIETGFGGNIMDPRVGTFFPDNLKYAILNLLEVWEKS
jgi:hypothetical protein